MAFKRTTSPTFRADVNVPVANEAGGYDQNSFTAIFAHATSSELEELRQLTNQELLKRKLVGWQMTDADTGQEVPYSADALAAVLQIPPTPMYMAAAFWEQINGARAKNS